MSPHSGQNIFTVSMSNSSLIPTGRTGCPRQCTRGHSPNSFARNLEYMVSSPAVVRMNLAWMRP
eukprot:scaffold4278_cov263-Pinguiococcus_pyrenoidosus.AAC.12